MSRQEPAFIEKAGPNHFLFKRTGRVRGNFAADFQHRPVAVAWEEQVVERRQFFLVERVAAIDDNVATLGKRIRLNERQGVGRGVVLLLAEPLFVRRPMHGHLGQHTGDE